MPATFYLGIDHDSWLGRLDVPMFVSHRTLRRRRTLPRARAPWALDSGGFTELSNPPHRWTFTPADYVAAVRRYRDEVGLLQWAAPMDHMCEPAVLAGAGGAAGPRLAAGPIRHRLALGEVSASRRVRLPNVFTLCYGCTCDQATRPAGGRANDRSDR